MTKQFLEYGRASSSQEAENSMPRERHPGAISFFGPTSFNKVLPHLHHHAELMQLLRLGSKRDVLF